jgi:DNA polymerase-3 subunit gamma/tau
VNAPTATPCNECDACREITAGTSVDVQEIDGASNNSVEDVRTLREGVRYLPVRGKKKVYIIDEVHMLSTGAFNALLKTLEEPPEHAVFIFATTEVHKIPVTILSRVQRYDFRLVSAQRIAAHLAKVLQSENVQFEPGALSVVAREAGGSVRDSLSLLEQVLAVGAAGGDGQAAVCSEQAAAEALGVADRALVGDLGKAILERDRGRVLALVGAAVDRNVDTKHLSHVVLEHLRDLLVARVVKEPSALIDASENELASLVETARRAPDGLLPLLFDRFSRVVDDVAKSPLPRFALEVGLVELCEIEPIEPIGDLVDRLERMEARLESGGARAAGPLATSAPAASPRAHAPPAPAPPARPSAPAPSAPAASVPAPAAARPSGCGTSVVGCPRRCGARASARPNNRCSRADDLERASAGDALPERAARCVFRGRGRGRVRAAEGGGGDRRLVRGRSGARTARRCQRAGVADHRLDGAHRGAGWAGSRTVGGFGGGGARARGAGAAKAGGPHPPRQARRHRDVRRRHPFPGSRSGVSERRP